MFLVARGGIEPPTQGFSILAPRLLPAHRFAGPRFCYYLTVWDRALPIQTIVRPAGALPRGSACQIQRVHIRAHRLHVGRPGVRECGEEQIEQRGQDMVCFICERWDLPGQDDDDSELQFDYANVLSSNVKSPRQKRKSMRQCGRGGVLLGQQRRGATGRAMWNNCSGPMEK